MTKELTTVVRKLASIRRIDAIDPIAGADAIEVATIGGWKVVVKKGEFAAGDLAVYFEIDSWIPHALAPFLSKGKEPRQFNGISGERLRTVKLRGQVSQGLLLPIETTFAGKDRSFYWSMLNEDVSDQLGIQKWEPPISPQMAEIARGMFPSFIRKTDQERCQNIVDQIFTGDDSAQYEVTVKLDGSSCTIYHNNGELGVCSRNLELKISDENKDNAYVRPLFDNMLNISLPSIGRNVALQGELMGPGIQGNREQFSKTEFFLFDIFDIDKQEYFTPAERYAFVEQLKQWWPPFNHVPFVARSAHLYDTLGIRDVFDLLKFAEGKSINHPVREGLVFKRIDGKFSFKAISNEFLVKEK